LALIRDVVAYLCSEYPHKTELSNARVAKMVYLADWKSVLVRGNSITSIKWVFDNYGPFSYNVFNSVVDDQGFEIGYTTNAFGARKKLIKAKDGIVYPTLNEEERGILDNIIDMTRPLNWQEFIKLIYSTYPILTQDRYSTLDLVALAQEYKENLSEIF